MAEDKLQLFCLVFPDNHPNDVFLVEIDSNELVGVLRDIIKLELFPRFNCLNVTDLFLWKCSIPADDNLGPTMDSIKFDQGDSRQVTYLNPTRKISRYFGDDEEPEGTIRILVQVPGHGESYLLKCPIQAQNITPSSSRSTSTTPGPASVRVCFKHSGSFHLFDVNTCSSREEDKDMAELIESTHAHSRVLSSIR